MALRKLGSCAAAWHLITLTALLQHLGEACLVVDDVSIRILVEQYINDFPAYNESYPDCKIGDWDTNAVTKMDYLFANYFSFNEPLNTWQTNNVEDMSYMFADCKAFNNDLSSWNVSKVTNMQGMFSDSFAEPEFVTCLYLTRDEKCSSVDASINIGGWDVSSVTDMSMMFMNAWKFNDDLSAWQTNNVINMSAMFKNGQSFTSDLNSWSTGNVVDMSSMFEIDSEFGNSFFQSALNFWDTSNVVSFKKMFKDARNFNSDLSSWDVSSVTDMSSMFEGCGVFNQNLNSWDVSSVTDMSSMFEGASVFHGNAFFAVLSTWNTESVVDMSGMFKNINQDFFAFVDMSSWNTSRVENMSSMFEFNQASIGLFNPLNSWDTSNVVDMHAMFKGANSFNSDISSWETSNVVDMSFMFEGASAFNQDISSWNVSSVTDMSSMLEGATEFISDVRAWETSNVVSLKKMFSGATKFNQDLGSWDVSSVTDMSYMFENAYVFNNDTSSWNVSLVEDMSGMFSNAYAFNGDISNWTTNSVNDMSKMFLFSLSFNQPIGEWNTSRVTSTRSMFHGAFNFDQPLNDWDTSSVVLMNNMFQNAGNFNQTLNAWDTSRVQLMSNMFQNATSFNQPLDFWKTNKVVGMANMFQNAASFDQQVNSWNVENVRTMNNMFLDASSFNQTFCWEIENIETDQYLDGTNGAMNEYETEGSCGLNNFLVEEENSNILEVTGLIIGSSIFSFLMLGLVLRSVKNRSDSAQVKSSSILQVKISCIKTGCGFIVFVLATYFWFVFAANDLFRPDLLDDSIAANTDEAFSFALVNGNQKNNYGLSLQEGTQYVVQVTDDFDGLVSLYDGNLKGVAQMRSGFEGLHSIDLVAYETAPVYFRTRDLFAGFGAEWFAPNTQSLPIIDNVLFYKPTTGFGSSSYSDLHFLEIKSESNLLVSGEFQVSEVITLEKGQPINVNLKSLRFSNFYEINVEKGSLYEINLYGDDSDVIYGTLTNQDGKRLGQTHKYPTDYTFDLGLTPQPRISENKQNKLFYEAESNEKLLLRVFLDPNLSPRRQKKQNPEDEYEELFVDESLNLNGFQISFSQIMKKTAENAVTLDFNDGKNAKTLVEMSFYNASIFYSQVKLLQYVAIFDTKGNLVASIDLSIPAHDFFQIEELEWEEDFNLTDKKLWLEFGRGNDFPEVQNVSIRIQQNQYEGILTTAPSPSPINPVMDSEFVDPADQYASCQPNPEVLTLLGTCLDGILYYCRNDEYPEVIVNSSNVPIDDLRGVCNCVEFLCTVVPSGDADFTLYLQYIHLAEAILLIPIILVTCLVITSFIRNSKTDFRIATPCLLLTSFSFSFVQDLLQYKLVETSQLFRDIKDVYIPASERNSPSQGTEFLNTAGINLVGESEISQEYIRNISVWSQACYVLANLFSILVFLNVCLTWAKIGYTSVLGDREQRVKDFQRLQVVVRFLELLLFSYSVYFTTKVVDNPDQYDYSLSILEFLACCLILIAYCMSLFLLLPKLIGFSSRMSSSSDKNNSVSQALESVVVTSTGVMICLVGVSVGYYFAIIEVQNYEDLLRTRNDVSLSGLFLAQHLCQIVALTWILWDLLKKERLERAKDSKTKSSFYSIIRRIIGFTSSASSTSQSKHSEKTSDGKLAMSKGISMESNL